MKKLYTNKDYADKAVEANSKGEKLYIHTYNVEYEAEVLDFEDVEVTKQIPVLDENGIERTDNDGNIITETIIETVKKPVMIEKTKTDEDGNEYVIQVQSSHKETKTLGVADLLVAPDNYYICYKDNYTDGIINKNFEEELAAKRQKQFEQDFFETSLGYIRRKVTMKNGETKDFLTDLLPSIAMGIQLNQPVNIICYNQPDFTQDVIIWEELQHIENVTSAFVQECFYQLNNDFLTMEV